MNKYKKYFYLLMCCVFFSGCIKTPHSAIEKTKREENGYSEIFNNFFIKRSTKTEDEVLKELEKMSKSKNKPKYASLISSTEMALGQRTIDFIENVKNYDVEDLYDIKMFCIPNIQERLEMIASLKGYKPLNSLEKKIIERIEYYTPSYSFWTIDDSDSGTAILPYPFYKDLKLGPLSNGKYLYVKLYVSQPKWENTVVIRNDKSKSYVAEIINKNKKVPVMVGVSTEPNGNKVYSYIILHKYPCPVRCFDLISQKWCN